MLCFSFPILLFIMLSQSIICSQHAVKEESTTVQVYIEETAIDPPTVF